MTEPDDPRERFAAIRAELERMDLPEHVPDEPPRDDAEEEDPAEAELRAIEERVARVGGRELPPVPGVPTALRPKATDSLKADREATRGLGNGLAVAYTLVGTPLVMYGFGYLLDSWLKTEFFKLVGIFAGGALGLFMAMYLLKQQEKGR